MSYFISYNRLLQSAWTLIQGVISFYYNAAEYPIYLLLLSPLLVLAFIVVT